MFRPRARRCRARAMAHGRPIGSLLLDMALFDMLFVFRLIIVFDLTRNMIQQSIDSRKTRKEKAHSLLVDGVYLTRMF